MASFVPDIPVENAPNWLGWSRSVQQPKADVSGEIIGKTIGKGLEDVGKIGHNVVQQQAESGIEDIQKQNVETLETIAERLNLPTGRSLLEPRAQADLPPDVQRVSQVSGMLESAKASGAISNTYQLGQIDAYLSDMRSKYPMFKGAIDAAARAQGVPHTANEYAQSLMRDINSFLTKKDEREGKAITEAYSVWGAPGVKEAYQKYQANKTSENLMNLENVTSGVQARKWDLDRLHQEISTSEAYGTERAKNARNVFVGVANNLIAERGNQIADKFGFKNEAEMEYAIHHPEQFSSVDMEQVASAHAGLELSLRKELEAEANKIQKVYNPVTNKTEYWSYAQQDPDYQKSIDNALKTHHAQGEFIKDKDIGPMAYWARLTQSSERDANVQILKSDLGTPTLIMGALKRLGMPEWADKYAQQSIADKLPDQIKALRDSTIGRSWTTLGQSRSIGISPAESMQKDIDAFVNKYGVKSPLIFNRFVDDLASLSNSKIPDENKVAKILYAYGPENSKLLLNWHKEGLQPDEPGKPRDRFESKPSRYNVLSAMLSPQITQEIRRLDSDPKFAKFHLWDMYKSRAEQMIDTQFRSSTQDLNKYEFQDPGRITYDDKTYEFKLDKNLAIAPSKEPYAMSNEIVVAGTIAHMNMATRRLAEIAKVEGGDPNAYIYKSLSNLGYKFEDHPLSAGGAMFNSIVATRLAERKALEEERRRAIELGTRK